MSLAGTGAGAVRRRPARPAVGRGRARGARRWAAGTTAAGLWPRLAGAGVTALAVPERCGGLGASPADLVVACEELGHHAVPGPVAESLAAVPVLLSGLAAEPAAAADGCRCWPPGT